MLQALRLPDTLTCGMAISAKDRGELLKLARRIEAAGFDAIWTGDHISFPVPILESLTKLSFLAAVTERVRLGTSILLVPLRHPTVIAKMTATIDVLSGGRFTLGIGVGGEFPHEFEACGIPVEERGKRTDLGIDIIRKLWTEDNVSYSSDIFNFGPVSIDPKPIQKKGPPILVGGRKGPTFRRAGQYGDGYISHMCSPDQFARNLAAIDEQAVKFGRTDVSFESAAFLFAFLDDTYEKALDRADATLSKMYATPFRDAARKYTLLGTPEAMLEQLQAFAAKGARHFIFSVQGNEDAFIDAFDRTIRPGLAALVR